MCFERGTLNGLDMNGTMTASVMPAPAPSQSVAATSKDATRTRKRRGHTEFGEGRQQAVDDGHHPVVRSPPDGSIDNELMNDCFGRNGNHPRQHAKSDCNLPRDAEPPLEDDNWRNAHRN
jgi:hypothetical protein